MVGLVGLDDREAGLLSPSRPADGLSQQLIRPLGGAFIRQVQRDIGRHDTDQGDLGHVQPLGDETGTDQHVEPSLGEGVEDTFDGPLVLGDIAIEPAYPKVRKGRPNLLLDALRPTAQILDPGRLARWAASRKWRSRAAVVAPQGDAGLVVDEAEIALRTALDVAAIATHHDRRRATAVDDENRPLAFRQRFQGHAKRLG